MADFSLYRGKYLDPKADLTFKKIFAGHPDLLISLLNALLPLTTDQQIESVEYLPVELIPKDPLHKDTLVDVRCRDIKGRQFLVEMQMAWTSAFKQRVLFNASKAYVIQAEKGLRYEKLQPVYSLNLVNDIFEPNSDDFIYNYNIVCDNDSKKIIEGLHFTFIELPKFKPQNIKEMKMAVLWLKFLTEIDSNTKDVPADLLGSPEICKALDELEVSAFSDAELRTYEKFWDVVSSERTLMEGKYEEGMAKGMEEGMAKGMAKGMEEGMAKEKLNIAYRMLQTGMSASEISSITGLPLKEIENL